MNSKSDQQKKWSLVSYGRWDTKKWVNHDASSINLKLVLNAHLLLVVSQDKVFESFNMVQDCSVMKAFAKGNIIILVHKRGDVLRKVRVEFENTFDSNSVNCCAFLSKFIIVQWIDRCSEVELNFKSWLEEIEKCSYSAASSFDIAKFNDVVQLCILDPLFPMLVNKCSQLFANLE